MTRRKRAVLLTPVVETGTQIDLSADPAGLTFRKKILPLGTISYPDPDAPGGTRKVTFDRGYHDTLIQAFRDHAIETPTMQLADERNAHNMDLLRTAGEVTDLSHEQAGDEDGPGLYATVRARNEDHAKLLHEIPRLGVSAQIKERFGRVDGRKFRAALRHILVTADPRVVGLGPWRAVSLSSADDGPVIDLTDGDYEEMEMPRRRIQTSDGTLALSDEDIEQALADAAAEVNDADDDSYEGDDTDDDAGAGTTRLEFSGGSGGTFSLAADYAEQRTEIAGMQAQLADAKWQKERLDLSNAGVPKPWLDEAEKVLRFPGETIVSLSDEDGREFTTDARTVIRSMLELAKGTIDLSDDVPGNGVEPILTDLSNDDDAFVAAWEKSSGIR